MFVFLGRLRLSMFSFIKRMVLSFSGFYPQSLKSGMKIGQNFRPLLGSGSPQIQAQVLHFQTRVISPFGLLSLSSGIFC